MGHFVESGGGDVGSSVIEPQRIVAEPNASVAYSGLLYALKLTVSRLASGGVEVGFDKDWVMRFVGNRGGD